MGDVVNLRGARTRKARAERAQTAERNRVLHGRTKAERQMIEAEARRAASNLDAHRRAATPGVNGDGDGTS